MEDPKIKLKPFFREGSEAFFHHVKYKNEEEVLAFLKEDRDLVFEWDHAYKTVFHWAAFVNSPSMTRLLLRFGKNVNMTDLNKRTPLHVACRNNRLDIIEVRI